MRGSRSATWFVVATLALAGCGGEEVAPEPERLPRAPELAGGVTVERGNYWTESLGDYLGPEFRTTPPDDQFARYGRRLLESRLREDLLEDHRWALSRQDIDTYSGQPDYDASERFLREVLGAEPR